MKSMFEEEWRPVQDFPMWDVSIQGRVRNKFSDHKVHPYVKNGDIYVEITDSEGRYIEVSLAAILLTSFPKESEGRE